MVKALCFNCEFLSTQRDFTLILTCAGLRTYPVRGHPQIVVSFLTWCHYLMFKSSLTSNTFSNVQKWNVRHPCLVASMSVCFKPICSGWKIYNVNRIEILFVPGSKFIISTRLRSYSCRVANSLIGRSPIG
jgi:hypothetical protein